jgi:putative ABC transport system ATP-binding protein
MIELKDVEFGWSGNSTVLAIPTLQIGAGELVFLKGPSGSGKSTLLGLISGVLDARSGSVAVKGVDLSQRSRAARDRFRADHIGYIFQMFNLLPYLSVLDNVLLPARFSSQRALRATKATGKIEAEAHRLLSALGLEAALHTGRASVQLSQGQQQRVAAARALFGQPELLIADEPTSSLDADARERFLDLVIGECKKAGTTLLFVSHDTSLARLFDRSIALTDINKASQVAA